MAAGLTVGQSLVVITTASHRAAFARQLKAEGFDVERVDTVKTTPGVVRVVDDREVRIAAPGSEVRGPTS